MKKQHTFFAITPEMTGSRMMQSFHEYLTPVLLPRNSRIPFFAVYRNLSFQAGNPACFAEPGEAARKR